jgi:hypothetical protein
VRADPEVERLLALARDVVGTQKDVADATATLEGIQGVLADKRRDRLALFLDLGRARQGSTAMLSALVEIRTEFTARARRLEAIVLNPPRTMSGWDQNRKNSVRANVFRFAPRTDIGVACDRGREFLLHAGFPRPPGDPGLTLRRVHSGSVIGAGPAAR